MAETAGRGTSWVSVVLGWLAALGAALDLKQHSGRHSRRTVRGLRGREWHHGGRDFWSDRLAPDAAHKPSTWGAMRQGAWQAALESSTGCWWPCWL
jgi:hypothetical protein